jgi:hypothetical protein
MLGIALPCTWGGRERNSAAVDGAWMAARHGSSAAVRKYLNRIITDSQNSRTWAASAAADLKSQATVGGPRE